MANWIQTYTGKRFDFISPSVEMVSIEDAFTSRTDLAEDGDYTYRSVEKLADVAALFAERERLLDPIEGWGASLPRSQRFDRIAENMKIACFLPAAAKAEFLAAAKICGVV